jgi:hypothetical protein
MTNQNHGTQQDRKDKSQHPKGQRAGQDQTPGEDEGARGDSSGGKQENPGSSGSGADRARKPGQKSGQS